MRNFIVGRVDGKPLLTTEGLFDGPKLEQFRIFALSFGTKKQAENAIRVLSLIDPTGVEQGHYYLDGPETECTN